MCKHDVDTAPSHSTAADARLVMGDDHSQCLEIDNDGLEPDKESDRVWDAQRRVQGPALNTRAPPIRVVIKAQTGPRDDSSRRSQVASVRSPQIAKRDAELLYQVLLVGLQVQVAVASVAVARPAMHLDRGA